jgi:hypothetical protein
VSRHISARSDSVVSSGANGPASTCWSHEGAAPLLSFDDPVAGQKVDCLTNGNTRTRRRATRLPAAHTLRAYTSRNSLPKNAGDLRIFHDVAVGNQVPIMLSRFKFEESGGKGRKDKSTTFHDMIKAAPLSPIIRLLALVFADVMSGITEASITRRFSMPRTRSCGSSTDLSSLPIRHVPTA